MYIGEFSNYDVGESAILHVRAIRENKKRIYRGFTAKGTEWGGLLIRPEARGCSPTFCSGEMPAVRGHSIKKQNCMRLRFRKYSTVYH